MTRQQRTNRAHHGRLTRTRTRARSRARRARLESHSHRARCRASACSCATSLAAVTHVAALAGDVIDPTHRDALAVLARGHAGLDAIINNAGMLGPSPQPALLDYPLDALVEVFLANVLAPLAVIQELQRRAQAGRADHQRHERRRASTRIPAGAATARARPRSSNSPRCSRSRIATCACTGSIPATCAPTCIRQHTRARTSAIARSRSRRCRDSSRVLEGDLPSGRYVASEVRCRR